MPPDTNTPNNLEIDKALKEFEMQNNVQPAEQIPQSSVSSDLPKMVQFVIKNSGGVIKDQRQAEYTLLGFVVIMLAFAFYLTFLR